MQDNKPHTSSQHDMLSATPPLAIYLPPTVKLLAGNAAEGAKFSRTNEGGISGNS